MREPWSGPSSLLVLVDPAAAVQFFAAVAWSTIASRFDVVGARPSFTSAAGAFAGTATARMVAALRVRVVGNAPLASDIDQALRAARIIEMLSESAELDSVAWPITVPRNLRLRPHAKRKRRGPPRSCQRGPCWPAPSAEPWVASSCFVVVDVLADATHLEEAA